MVHIETSAFRKATVKERTPMKRGRPLRFRITAASVLVCGFILIGTAGLAEAAFNQDAGSLGLVVMEAENFNENVHRGDHAWVWVDHSGAQAMQAFPDSGARIARNYLSNSPYLRFTVNFVTTGVHYIWLRGFCTGKDKSVHVGLDGKAFSTGKNVSLPINQGWVWSGSLAGGGRARLRVKTTGLHTVEIYMREDGFRLDKVLLTKSSSYVPSGIGPPESPTSGTSETHCSDGIDNDGDGLTDCDDPDCSGAAECLSSILRATFDSGADGFTYWDDTFRATNNPAYASGSYDAAGGYSGGGLRVSLGGVDKTNQFGMSGGWSRSFFLNADATVHVHLRYRLVVPGDYDPDECGQALVAINGLLLGSGSQDYLAQLCGPGDSGPDQDTGWQRATLAVPLARGTHTLTVGGWNNKKTGLSEVTHVFFDEISLSPVNPPDVIFSDTFSDGSAARWTVVDDAGKSSTWQVLDGKYTQSEDRVFQWLKSYHLGSYSYYTDGMALTDYQVKLNIKSLAEITGARDSIGVMVRYQNRNNYIRFLMSRMQGFLRLESRVNGQFKTISHNGRGIDLGADHEVLIDVRCGESNCDDGVDNDDDTVVDEYKILVYLNQELIFSAEDNGPSSGSIALFTQSRAEFDNVVISKPAFIPRIGIQQPVAHSVAISDAAEQPYELQVAAKVMDVPDSYGVKFVIDSGAPSEIVDFTNTYSGTFSNVPRGDRTVSAIIVDQDGDPLMDPMGADEDFNPGIGVGGKFLVAFGDSITSGFGDDRADDNNAVNGKLFSRGYTPILTSLLSNYFIGATPVFVANEGLGGTTSKDGRDRLAETLDRFPESQIWLVLFGTNDSSGTMPVLSGVDCQEPYNFDPEDPGYDSDCRSTFKGYLRDIILNLKARGKIPALAYIPYIYTASGAQLSRIIEYNQAIGDLFGFHQLPVAPPDFYHHFSDPLNQNKYFDEIHPNGDGYADMAGIWFNQLVNSSVFD